MKGDAPSIGPATVLPDDIVPKSLLHFHAIQYTEIWKLKDACSLFSHSTHPW
jgi:hypothetical protein